MNTLLSFEDVNLKSMTKTDPSPLRFAVIHRHEGEVELLNYWKDIKPNLVDWESGQTSFSLAAMEGCESIMQLLLANNNGFHEPSDMSTCQIRLTWAALNSQ